MGSSLTDAQRRDDIPADENFCYYSELELDAEPEVPHKDSDIKAAFRKLSRLYHPDLNRGNEEANARYVRIQKAHRVLGDRILRKVYDIAGVEGVRRYEEERNRPEGMRNQMGMFMRQSTPTNSRLKMKVDLDKIYNGESIVVSLKKNKICAKCRGTGAFSKEHFKPCSVCKGEGHTVVQQQFGPFIQNVQRPCDACRGKGKVPTKSCPVCRGKGTRHMAVPLDVLLERGLPENHEVKFELEADETPDELPGDLILEISTNPHPVFRRDGNDLHTVVRLTLLESLIGFRKVITHLDDRRVAVSHRGMTPPGTVRKVFGEGMPIHHVPSDRGDLYVKYEVDFPTSLSEEQRQVIRETLPASEEWINLDPKAPK